MNRGKKISQEAIRYTLITVRTKQGLTQSELSVRSGISRQHISRIECQGDIPTIETLHRIAEGANLTLKDVASIYEEKYNALKQKLYLQVAETDENKYLK